MSEIVYRKGEVWLCRSGLSGLEPHEIISIVNGYVLHRHNGFERWASAFAWHQMAQTKLGVVRRFLGIRIGITQ